jgi:hypothetical protein
LALSPASPGGPVVIEDCPDHPSPLSRKLGETALIVSIILLLALGFVLLLGLVKLVKWMWNA